MDSPCKTTGQGFAENTQPEWAVGRSASYNVWRVLTPAPQDVPLALCDARSFTVEDLVPADAVFDDPKDSNKIIFSFEGLTVRANPDHRWMYFHDMSIDEVIVFKSFDSDPNYPCFVPHSAFTAPKYPEGTQARISIEMRATVYWKNN